MSWVDTAFTVCAYGALGCVCVGIVSGKLHTSHTRPPLPVRRRPSTGLIIAAKLVRRSPLALMLTAAFVCSWLLGGWWMALPWVALAVVLWRRHRTFQRLKRARRAREDKPVLTGRPPRASQQKWARKTIRRLDPGYGELLDTVSPLGAPLSTRESYDRVMPRRKRVAGPKPPAGGFNREPRSGAKPAKPPAGSSGMSDCRPPLEHRHHRPEPVLDGSRPRSEQLRALLRWQLDCAEQLTAGWDPQPHRLPGVVTIPEDQARAYRAHIEACENLKLAIAEAEKAERSLTPLSQQVEQVGQHHREVLGALEIAKTNLAAFQREQRLAATIAVEHRPACPSCGMTGRQVELLWASMKDGDPDVWRCGLGHRFNAPEPDVPPAGSVTVSK